MLHDSYTDLTQRSKVFVTQSHASQSKGTNFIIEDDYCINEYTDTNKKETHCFQRGSIGLKFGGKVGERGGEGSLRPGLVSLKTIDELTNILIC